MVEQSGEPLLLSFPCYFSHTVQPLGHALPVLCRVHVRLNDVLPRLCPFLPNLRGRLPFLVRLVHRYCGTVRLLRTCMSAVWLLAFAGPAFDRPDQGAAGDLPGSRACLFLSVRGFLDYAGPTVHSRLAWLPCCLPPTRNEVGILIYGLFAAPIAPPTGASSTCFKRHLAMSPARLEVRMDSLLPLSCRALASYNMPV